MGWKKITAEGASGNTSFFCKPTFGDGIHLLIDGDLDGGFIYCQVYVLDGALYVPRQKDGSDSTTWRLVQINTTTYPAGCFFFPLKLKVTSGTDLRLEILKVGGTEEYAMYIWETPYPTKYQSDA